MHDALTDFDRARMRGSQEADFDTLVEARKVKLESDAGKLTRSVPIYLDGAAAGAVAPLFRSALERDGFTLVETAEAAAVRFELSAGALEKGGLKIGNTQVETARIDVDLRGTWTLKDEILGTLSVTGVGRGRSAEDKARETATEELLAEVRKLAEGS